MKLRDFLEQFVDGYLFNDLHSMAIVIPPVGLAFGAVGYPMVATTLAGIELFGALTSTKPFDRNEGATYFREFWQGSLYADHRRALQRPVYQLVRHGLAHVAIAKPLIVVHKQRDNPLHLHRDAGGALIIDALVLAEDLERAYTASVKSHLSGPRGASMQKRLTEMLHQYSAQARKMSGIIETAPLVGSHPFHSATMLTSNAATPSNAPTLMSTSPSGGTFINSPAPPPSHRKP